MSVFVPSACGDDVSTRHTITLAPASLRATLLISVLCPSSCFLSFSFRSPHHECVPSGSFTLFAFLLCRLPSRHASHSLSIARLITPSIPDRQLIREYQNSSKHAPQRTNVMMPPMGSPLNPHPSTLSVRQTSTTLVKRMVLALTVIANTFPESLRLWIPSVDTLL